MLEFLKSADEVNSEWEAYVERLAKRIGEAAAECLDAGADLGDAAEKGAGMALLHIARLMQEELPFRGVKE